MNADPYLQRARLLIQQHRSGQAAEQLRQLLANDPNNAEAHSLLAVCLLENQDQWHAATREAEQAVGLAPDQFFSHYVLASVHEKRNRFPEALQAIEEAIRLLPEDSDCYGLKASILAQQQNWKGALESASLGLYFDAENEACLSLRAIALERLGKTQGAIDQADAAVSRNPDSAMAHSTRGWALLNSNRYQEAQEAFREALRLSPTNEMARIGMIQALNNHYFLFRWIFKFYTFVGRMAQGAQWAIIIGLFLGMKILRGLANAYPVLEPFVLPISIIYLAFCLLSWIATPLFNTFLRFHSFGKYLLSDQEKWASNCIAGLGFIGMLGGCQQAFRGDLSGAILIFLSAIFMTLPVATAFNVDEGWPRHTAIACCGVMGLLCASSIVLIAVDGDWGIPFALYGLSVMLFSFLGNYLSRVTVRH